jgi:phosphoglycolate phosphatase-like HAD superfamily hydrolase
MTQALLFDLDGTLIDSSDDLTRALNAAFAEHGLGALSREQVEPLIGQGAPALIERALRTSGQTPSCAGLRSSVGLLFTALARDIRGIRRLDDLVALPGSRVIDGDRSSPGTDPSIYAYVKTTVHRNLFRISLPK